MNLRVSLLVFVAILATPVSMCAAEEGGDSLRVVRTFVHSDRKPAELCIEFNRPLDAVYKRMRSPDNFTLEAGHEKVTLAESAISLAGNQLCLAGLRHRTEYQLAVKAARSQQGDKLEVPYKTVFFVPARKASLSLTGMDYRSSVLPLSPPPKVQSVNIEQIDLELYAIEGIDNIAAAWTMRQQAVFAPTEALYLAQHKGKRIWHTSLRPKQEEDDLGQTALNAADFEKYPPGLYMLLASSPAQGRDPKGGLRPMAAVWLVRSSIQLEAARDDLAYHVFAARAGEALSNLSVALMDQDQKIVRKEITNAKGIATFPLDDRVRQIVALADDGSPAVVAVRDDVPYVTASGTQTDASFDHGVYAPLEGVVLHLLARDGHGQPWLVPDSVVRVWRADGSFHQQIPVRLEPSGSGRISFTAPARAGIWRVTWQQANGKILAEKELKVTDKNAMPTFTIELSNNSGDMPGVVRVHSRGDAAGSRVPFVAGHMTAAAQPPAMPFPRWPDYLFGDGRVVTADVVRVAKFVTDARGTATTSLNWPQHGAEVMPRQWRLEAVGDAAAQAISGSAIFNQLPELSVGVCPKSRSGKFPENGIAVFSVIALDRMGQRQSAPDLWYQIYEQGRLFSWRQTEGRWDAVPVASQRRVASSRLPVAASMPATLEVPVASGSYRLEITNEDGVVLAGMDFSAGWGDNKETETQNLDLKVPAKNLEVGKTYSVTAVLPKAAWVTATLADDRAVRATVQGHYKAGNAILPFLPVANMGPLRRLRVVAHYADGQQAIGERDVAPPLTLPAPAPSPSPPLSSEAERMFPVQREAFMIEPQTVWKTGDVQKKKDGKTAALWLAAVPLDHAAGYMAQAMGRVPVMTRHIAMQGEIVRLWASTLGWDKDAEDRRRLELRLLARQNSDGGFGSEPGQVSSLEDTAAAVTMLGALRDERAKPSLQRAVEWLHRYLDNVWFDEAERSARATAYAALAAADGLDAANLHYFSDNSTEKELTPTAMAALARAFAQLNDRPAAELWSSKALHADVDAAAAVLLASNPFVPSQLTQEKLNKIVPSDWVSAAYYVQALGFLAQREEARVLIDKGAMTWRGVATISSRTVSIDNNHGERTLFAARVDMMPLGRRSRVVRQIHRLDGSVTGVLEKGETYVVILEGSADANFVAVQDNPGPALMLLTCPMGSGDVPFLPWLSGEAPLDAYTCEKTGNALDMTAKPKGRNWKLAYMVQATGIAGRAALPRVSAFSAINLGDKDGRR